MASVAGGGGGKVKAKKVYPPEGGHGPGVQPYTPPARTSRNPTKAGKPYVGLKPIGGRGVRITPDIYPPYGGKQPGLNASPGTLPLPPTRKVRVSKNFIPTTPLDPSQVRGPDTSRVRRVVPMDRGGSGIYTGYPVASPYPGLGGLGALQKKKSTPGPAPKTSTRQGRRRVGGQ